MKEVATPVVLDQAPTALVNGVEETATTADQASHATLANEVDVTDTAIRIDISMHRDATTGDYTLWTFEQDRRWNARWERYLVAEQKTRLWAMRPETEQERYRVVLEKLRLDDDQKMKQHSAVSEEHVDLTVRNRGRKGPRSNKDSMDIVHAAADKVVRHKSKQIMRENFHKKYVQILDISAGGSYGFKKIWLGVAEEPDSRQLLIATDVLTKGYYLAHHGGDYVFRYRHIQRPDPLHSCYSCSSNISDGDSHEPVWEDPSSCHVLHAPDNATLKKDFTYCGLVPRAWKEYAARFEIVCRDVLRLVASIIPFEPEDGWALTPPWTGPIDEDFEKIDNLAIMNLWNGWNMKVYVEFQYLCWVQDKAQKHPRFHEFGYLMMQLSELSGGMFIHNMALLVTLVEQATNMELAELRDAHELCTEEEALHQLCDERNVQQCMVFEDDLTVDIHAFYRHSRFTTDPLHPHNRFDGPDVEAALEELYSLFSLGTKLDGEHAADLARLRERLCLPVQEI